LNFVSPFSELPQLAFGTGIEGPDALLPLLGEAKALQGPEAANTQGPLHGVELLGGGDREDACLGSGDEGPVKAGQALLADLVEELLNAFHLGLGTPLEGDEGLGASAHPMGDVVPCHHEVATVLVAPADHNVGVGVTGVEMVHSRPVELGVEVALHLGQEVANEGLEVGEARPLVGGDDEAELVRVLLGPVQEGAAVHVIPGGIVEPTAGAFARDTITNDVLQVSPRRTEVAPMMRV